MTAQSYAFSGPAYAVMRTRVRVVSVTEYESWLEEQAAGIQEAQAFVQERVAEAAPGERNGGGDGGRAMSDGRALAPHRPELVTDRVPSAGPRWLELATSSDHKDIGRLFIGAALSFLVRRLDRRSC